jgi:hypothetical protein
MQAPNRRAPIAAELSAADWLEARRDNTEFAGRDGWSPRKATTWMTMNLPAPSSRMFPVVGRGSFPISRRFMTDNVELNVDALSKTLKKQASGFRHLADESIEGEFRSRLLELALDYERQAKNLEHVNLAQ